MSANAELSGCITVYICNTFIIIPQQHCIPVEAHYCDEAVANVKAVVNERRNTSESSRHMGLLRKVSVRELISIYL